MRPERGVMRATYRATVVLLHVNDGSAHDRAMAWSEGYSEGFEAAKVEPPVPPPHVPTPEELDDLLSDISMAGYASEAREIVEVWTRKWWGVESAFTTTWNAER